MSQSIVFLHSLKPDVDPAEYERFVLEIDYPLTRRQPGVIGYEVTPLPTEIAATEAIAFQYLEVIEVEDADAYFANVTETDDQEYKDMLARWMEMVDRYAGSIGSALR
jgi:REDY-like protein HapK